MLDRLKAIENRYNEINALLMTSDVISHINQMKQLSKEQASLQKPYDLYQDYKKVLNELVDAEAMLKDLELGEMAKEEVNNLNAKKLDIEKQLEFIFLAKDPNDDKNVIVEIRGAAGGEEASIFAGDLYRMYTRYAEVQGWKIEPYVLDENQSGGYSQVEFLIKGDGVYSKLKYESGAHRVQRVPETETQGRVHTSTATVAVMPEADEIDVEIRNEDLKIDVYRSGGAGGQHVNTTDSAVRITHLPTGVIAACQNERSQIKNRESAMRMLRARIFEVLEERRLATLGEERRNKVGTGDRSEKIRTYNYPQNRVTDHRIGFSVQELDRVMDGKLDDIIAALINEDQARKIKGE